MQQLKKVLKKLISPPKWLLCFLTVISTVGLLYVFLTFSNESVMAYAIYTLSAYTLTALCVFFATVIPKWYNSIKIKVYKNSFGKRYFTDTVFRVKISLYFSLAINVLYSAFKLSFGIYYSSIWWGATGIYYTLLAILRFVLLRYMRRSNEKKGLFYEYKRYKLCGILMLVLNISLSGMVVQMVWENKGTVYPGFTIFVVAGYTFYAVVSSATDIIKYRRQESPILEASKSIRFASAVVSLLSLETAMIVQFGENETFRRTMTACTGVGVCVLILGVSVYMIAKANNKMKEMNKIL